MAATTNPLHGTHHTSEPQISTETHTIAGILCTVHGLAELPASATSISCLWLLHPRLQTRETMAPLGAQILHAYNSQAKKKGSSKGLIAVSFDQRNHGSRLVDKLHNEAWRQGNPRHAQDMFSCYHGTAQDTSHLITHLESYIFHTPSHPKVTEHLVLGVSLGGHAAWHLVLADPRITAAIVGIGCPDYTRLMTDRARLSKRKSYTESSPPGSAFLGSVDFPNALRQSIAESDPAGLLLPNSYDPQHQHVLYPAPEKAALDRMSILLRERLQGKRIIALSGQADKLVPYAAGEPFLKVFKQLINEDKTLNIGFEDVLFDGVGHAFPRAMADRATTWICDLLAGEEGSVSSKI